MLSILLILLIVFILWPLIRNAWRIWSQIRSMRRFMADPEGEIRRRAARAGHSAPPPPRAPRKKKINRDVGEYVDFTEVELSAEERTAAENRTASSPRIKTEEQISDIKWVDIK
jgi:hypothetical protein